MSAVNSPNEYWFYARQCSELAARTPDEGRKQFMLAMAETWRRLARGDLPESPTQERGQDAIERRLIANKLTLLSLAKN